MKYTLSSYTKNQPFQIQAFLKADSEALTVTYQLRGELDQLIIRKENSFQRRWDLWEETCFELFLKNPKEESYIEFNFSPSKDWNSFYMTHFRNNVGELQTVQNPSIAVNHQKELVELEARIPLAEIPNYPLDLLKSKRCLVGITTVLKHQDETLSHWDINNRQEGKADFHDETSFLPLTLQEY